jgi:hypothetical protein
MGVIEGVTDGVQVLVGVTVDVRVGGVKGVYVRLGVQVTVVEGVRVRVMVTFKVAVPRVAVADGAVVAVAVAGPGV